MAKFFPVIAYAIFILPLFIAGIIFMLRGGHRGILRAVIELLATAAAAVGAWFAARPLSDWIWRMCTPKLRLALAEKLPGSVTKDIPMAVDAAEGLIKPFLTLTVFMLAFILALIVLRILIDIFMSKRKEAKNGVCVLFGTLIGLLNAVLFTCLLTAPLFGTVNKGAEVLNAWTEASPKMDDNLGEIADGLTLASETLPAKLMKLKLLEDWYDSAATPEWLGEELPYDRIAEIGSEVLGGAYTVLDEPENGAVYDEDFVNFIGLCANYVNTNEQTRHLVLTLGEIYLLRDENTFTPLLKTVIDKLDTGIPESEEARKAEIVGLATALYGYLELNGKADTFDLTNNNEICLAGAMDILDGLARLPQVGPEGVIQLYGTLFGETNEDGILPLFMNDETIKTLLTECIRADAENPYSNSLKTLAIAIYRCLEAFGRLLNGFESLSPLFR